MYDLIRFFAQKEYAETFLKGQLYMNSLGYFWLNGFQSQKDMFEGTVSFVDPNDTPFPSNLTKHILGSVMYRLEAMKYCNLLCMVRHGYDPKRKQVERIDPLMKSFGKYVVIVRKVELFVNRIYDALANKKDCYGLMGPVTYHRRDAVIKDSDCFDKCKQFSWQKEWRFALLPNYSALKYIASQIPEDPYLTPYTFSIEDISDIAEIHESKDLFDNIQSVYSGYKEVDKIIEDKGARKFLISGLPLPYDVFCEDFMGWMPRSSFLRKILEIDGGRYKPIFTIG